MKVKTATTGLFRSLFLFILCACGSEYDSQTAAVVLTASCADGGAADADTLCPATRVLECNRDYPTEAHVVIDHLVCDDDPILTLSHDHLDDVGRYEVSVAVGAEPICLFVAEVVDTEPPVVDVTNHSMWPPNHKMHRFGVYDCVTVHDACDLSPEARIVWATSDEPFEGRGDGNHEPDIRIAGDRQSVDLRAERSGREDGRVYRIGVEVTDGSGNVTDTSCRVTVPHDQSGTAAVDSGRAVRVDH